MISLALALLLSAPPPWTGVPRQEPAPAFPAAPPESVGLSAAALAELAAEVRGFVDRDMLVGGELLVIQDRRTVLHECFGLMDREEELAWGPGTVCNVRSMTKPLTGAAAQLLIERGLLSLDDPAAEYLPGFDTDRARGITVRQLLTHRSGLPLTALTSMDEHASLIDMGNAIGARGPEFEPGSRFWYSDSGTDALGAIVEIVSEQRLDEFVREQLLVPLGMRESFYFLDDEDPRRSRIASLYSGGVGHWRRFLDPDQGAFYPFAWGSQSLYSTPEDYARFLAMWMDGGRVGERVVLPEAAVARSLTPVSEMSMLGSEARFPTSFAGLEVYYGQLAVLHVPVEAEGAGPATILGHSGSDGTIAWAWPQRDLMILFFTQSRGGGAVLRLEEPIERLLLSPGAQPDPADVPAELRPVLGTYVADWANHMKEELTVEVRGGRLTLDVPSQMVFALTPAAEPGQWSFEIAPSISVWFERDDAGSVDCLRIRQGQLTFEAPRQGSPHERELAEAGRRALEAARPLLGRYRDPEAQAEVEVWIDGDYLAVRTAKQEVFHLWKVPISDAWLVRENPQVSLTFQEQEGRIVSLTRHDPGGAKLVMPRVE